MTLSKPAAVALAIVLPLLAATGCANKDEMSSLRTEVMNSQETANAAKAAAESSAMEAKKAAESARMAADEAKRAADAAEQAAAKADMIYQQSLRK